MMMPIPIRAMYNIMLKPKRESADITWYLMDILQKICINEMNIFYDPNKNKMYMWVLEDIMRGKNGT